ncbi:MAG: sugar phosphate isomerase/epimerase, partial [Chloroflexi bacterium]|nr:sugar phosphate isomerase/epimerase [Chloroflexota bacterium]
EALGADVALFNADTRPIMVKALPRYLDAVEDLDIAIAVQNHPGRALETGEDYRAVFAGVGNDPRLKGVLEVGSFHHYGWSWRQGYDLLAGRIALVHIKDMVGQQSVPFGTGEVDIPGLIEHLSAVGYRGKFVLEMSVVDKENTIQYTQEAFQYMVEHGDRFYAG